MQRIGKRMTEKHMIEERNQNRPEVELGVLRILVAGLDLTLSSKDCGYLLNPSTSGREYV